MKPASAKNKGRKLQQMVRDFLISILGLHPQDILSRSMGAAGEDVILSVSALSVFPYSIECKNVEKLNVWMAYDQAIANQGNHTPLLIIKKNGRKPLVVVDAEHFIGLHKDD